MIKLNGFRVSNYYNMVKFALLEKGIAFEEVHEMPNQEADFTAKSPMGKVPCLSVDEGFLSETSIIMDYLEEANDSSPLYPANAFKRAKARELIRCCEMYIELAARRHYGHLFFGEDIDENAVTEVRPVMEKGLRAISQLANFGPYFTGSEFSYVDIIAYHCFTYPVNVGQAIYEWDILAEVAGLKESLAAIAAREHCQTVDAGWQAALTEFQGN